MMRPAYIFPEKRHFYWLLGGFKNEGILEMKSLTRAHKILIAVSYGLAFAMLAAFATWMAFS